LTFVFFYDFAVCRFVLRCCAVHSFQILSSISHCTHYDNCLLDPRALEQSIWSVSYWFEEYIWVVSKAVAGTVDKREEREAVGSGTSWEVDRMFAECGAVWSKIHWTADAGYSQSL